MEGLEILLLVAITGMGILLIVLLHKITLLKKQTDDIVQEVKSYVAFVTADEQVPSQTPEVHKQERKEEMESHILQAVLGEYFL